MEQPLDLTVRKSSDKGPKERLKQQQQEQRQQQQQQQRQQQKPRTGKRVQLLRSGKVKLLAIQRIKNGATKATVSRALGVPESTIRGWCKSEKSIREKLLRRPVDDSESCSPTSDSPSSSIDSLDDNNLVLDMSAGRSRSNNSSDEENREPASKKSRLEVKDPSAPMAHTNNGPYAMQNEAILLALLMAHQRDNRQQMMSLQMDNCPSMSQETCRARTVDEVIAIGERFLELLENSDDPSVTMFTVGHVREVLDRLRENRR